MDFKTAVHVPYSIFVNSFERERGKGAKRYVGSVDIDDTKDAPRRSSGPGQVGECPAADPGGVLPYLVLTAMHASPHLG